MNKAICERFEEATARIERLLFIAGVVAEPSEDLKNFLQDIELENIEECFGKLPSNIIQCLDDDDLEYVQEFLFQSNHLGFLIQFATPVMEKQHVGRSYSWGYYSTRWVYGETLEDALNNGFAWVAKMRKQETKKPRNKKTAAVEPAAADPKV